MRILYEDKQGNYKDDDWQSKVSAVFNVHTAVTEMNKVDSLKNCDIVIVNTAFISHSMYFAVQKTAQNALFMYVDNLNVDTIATLLTTSIIKWCYNQYK